MIEVNNLCTDCKKKVKKYCCYQSVIVVDKKGKRFNVIIKSKPCKYLEVKTLKCLVYKNKHKLNPYCLPIEEAIRQNALQADCLYVKDDEDYKGDVPKIDYVPKSLPKHVKLGLQAMEQMSEEEFRRMYLPLLL